MREGRLLKIAVTGATGFVGRPVCAQLTAAGHTVRAIERTHDAPSGLAAAEVVTGCDLEQGETWDAVARDVDVIVHLAARAHVMHDDPQKSDALYRRANVHVTQGLAEAARRHGVRRFVYMSSIKVNGERTTASPFRADDVPAPEDAYGRSKLEAETALLACAGDAMETVIVRPPLLYGPGVRGNMRRLFQLVDRGLPLPLGSIRNARDMLYVGHLADLVEITARHPAAAGRIILARDGDALSTPDLVHAIGTALGRKARCFPFPVAALRFGAHVTGFGGMAARLIDDLRIDDMPTRQHLGWQPRWTLAEALKKTALSFRGADV